MANTTFRPKAKLVSMLGESLISDNSVGLYELVKNSYDADASSVLVELTDTKTQKKTALVIRDDGTGMTTNDLLEKWMTPANPHKAETKHGAGKTEKGRTPLGEKGIGRFAVHKLGRKLTLITRCRGEQESVLSVNWDQFDEDVFLDEIEIAIEQREPQEFLEEQTGTKLVITEAREQWTEDQVKAVQQNFRRLQLPSDEAERDFSIELRCPDYPALENIDSNEILENCTIASRRLSMSMACALTPTAATIRVWERRLRAPPATLTFLLVPRGPIKKRSPAAVYSKSSFMCGTGQLGIYGKAEFQLPIWIGNVEWVSIGTVCGCCHTENPAMTGCCYKSRINDPSGKRYNQMTDCLFTTAGQFKRCNQQGGFAGKQAGLGLVKGALEFTNL